MDFSSYELTMIALSLDEEEKETNKTEKGNLIPSNTGGEKKRRRNFTLSILIWLIMRANPFSTFEWTLIPSKWFCQKLSRKYLRQTQPPEKPSLLDKSWQYVSDILSGAEADHERSNSVDLIHGALAPLKISIGCSLLERERSKSGPRASVHAPIEIHVMILNWSENGPWADRQCASCLVSSE